MSITLKDDRSFGGTAYPAGTTLSLDGALEANLVAQGLATWAGQAPYQGGPTHPAQFGLDDKGNVTGLVGPDGVDMLGPLVGVNPEMTPRAMTAAIQAALDLGGTIHVFAPSGSTITLDQPLRAPSNTTLILPDNVTIKGNGNARDWWSSYATVAVDGSGGIASVTLDTSGGKTAGYTLGAPTAFVGGAFFEPAELWAYADGSGSIVDVYIANGGRGYHTAPTLTFHTAPNSQGVGAQQRYPTFEATVSGGSVTAVAVTDGGLQYDFVGWYPIRVKGGMHARLTCNVDGAGVVQTVTVNTPGLDYGDVPLANLKFHMMGGNPDALFPLFTNADWFNGNENIKVIGGIWDGNVDDTDPVYHYDEFMGMAFLLISCDNTVMQPRKIQKCVRYGFHIIDCWNTKIFPHDVENGFDDVHFTGANRDASVDRIYGATGDDFVTATALERPEMDFYAGNINRIDLDGCQMNGSMFALAAWTGKRPDGTSYEIDNISYRNIGGISASRLLRMSTVDADMAGAEIKDLTLDMADIRWPDTFTGSEQRDPAYGPLIECSYVTVNTLRLKNLKVHNKSVASDVGIELLEALHGGAIKTLYLDNVQIDLAGGTQYHFFNFNNAGAAPERIVCRNGCSFKVGTQSNGKYVFNFGNNKPTDILDLGDTVVDGLGVAASSLAAGDWRITSQGAHFTQDDASATGISYKGVVRYSAFATTWDGTQRAFVAASSVADSDSLYWSGAGNNVTCTVHESNVDKGRLYPKDYSLSMNVGLVSSQLRISKEAGGFFTNSTPGHGVQAGAMKCGLLRSGQLVWIQEGSGAVASTISVVNGGSGYAVNDLVNVDFAAGDQLAPAFGKVTSVSGGAITYIYMDPGYSSGPAYVTNLPSVSGLSTNARTGSGSGATVNLNLT